MTSVVMNWLKDAISEDRNECIVPVFKQSSVYWMGQIRSIAWIICEAGNGPPADHILVPIRSCEVKRCGCKQHYRWGTASELRIQNMAQRNRRGEDNPNSKLSWGAVSEIRSAGLNMPRFSGNLNSFEGQAKLVEHNRVLMDTIHRRQVMADKYGITLQTLDKVIKGYVWNEAERPFDHSGPEGDEF